MTNDSNATEANFENLLAELEAIAKRLEEGKLPLDEALACYTRGIQVKKACEDKLNQAQLTIEQLQPQTDPSA